MLLDRQHILIKGELDRRISEKKVIYIAYEINESWHAEKEQTVSSAFSHRLRLDNASTGLGRTLIKHLKYSPENWLSSLFNPD